VDPALAVEASRLDGELVVVRAGIGLGERELQAGRTQLGGQPEGLQELGARLADVPDHEEGQGVQASLRGGAEGPAQPVLAHETPLEHLLRHARAAALHAHAHDAAAGRDQQVEELLVQIDRGRVAHEGHAHLALVELEQPAQPDRVHREGVVDEREGLHLVAVAQRAQLAHHGLGRPEAQESERRIAGAGAAHALRHHARDAVVVAVGAAVRTAALRADVDPAAPAVDHALEVPDVGGHVRQAREIEERARAIGAQAARRAHPQVRDLRRAAPVLQRLDELEGRLLALAPVQEREARVLRHHRRGLERRVHAPEQHRDPELALDRLDHEPHLGIVVGAAADGNQPRVEGAHVRQDAREVEGVAE
jgi:hypothetical protein